MESSGWATVHSRWNGIPFCLLLARIFRNFHFIENKPAEICLKSARRVRISSILLQISILSRINMQKSEEISILSNFHFIGNILYSTGKTMCLTSKNWILNKLILEYDWFWEIWILILLVEEFSGRIWTYNLDFRTFRIRKRGTTIFQKNQKIMV